MDYVMGQLSIDGLYGDEEYVVHEISYQEAVPYLLTIHYARRIPTIVYAYGLYKGQDCIGVVTYGIPASPNLSEGLAGESHRDEVLELNRLVIVPGYEGQNLASMLVGRSLKMIPGNHYIVSYADVGGWGHIGYVYQATNWMYTGMTKRRTDIAGGGQNSHSRHYVKGSLDRVVRSEKHRYVYIVAESKKQRKKMLKDLKYKPLDYYPKGESRHYDTENPKGLLTGGKL